MVEADSDPSVVTAVIRRETQEAAAARAAEAAAAAAQGVQLNPVARQSAPDAVAVLEPSRPVAPAGNAPSAFGGTTQILVAAALVAVLLVAWFVERRSTRKVEEVDHG